MTTAANPFANKRTSTPPPAADTATATPTFTEPKKAAAAPGPDLGADPFAQPSGPGSGDKITDFEGYLLLVTPTEFIPEMTTKLGVSEAVRADVVVLDHPDGIYESDGVLVFQTALRRELKKILDNPLTTMVLGRLGKADPKPGKSAAYIFQTYTEAERAVAMAYINRNKK